MSNYIGYFRGLHSNILYSVRIITDSADTDYTEILLAGDSPFVVSSSSDDLYEPVRTSTATIQMVSDDYHMDMYSPYATGTTIQLYNDTDNKLVWKGYLKPNLYDQGYESCNETIQLEASDCLAAMQYFGYSAATGTKSVVQFADIFGELMDKVGLKNLYMMATKQMGGDNIPEIITALTPYLMTISEQNFFTSDTDEPWMMDEVLEEICRYIGFTAIQQGEDLYLVDYAALKYQSSSNNLISYRWTRTDGTWKTTSYDSHINGNYSITKDSYMGNGASISLDTIYNKATINCSTYDIEDLMPDIYADDNCEPMYGTWQNCSYINISQYSANYISPKAKVVSEEEKDNKYVYVHRLLKNKYYTGVYYSADTNNNLIETDIREVYQSTLSSGYKTWSMEVYDYNDGWNKYYYDVCSGATAQVQFKNASSSAHSITYYVKYNGSGNIHYDATGTGDRPAGWYRSTDDSEIVTHTADTAGSIIVPAQSSVTITLDINISNPDKDLDYISLCSIFGWYVMDDEPSSKRVSFGGGIFLSPEYSPTEAYVGGTLVDLANYERIPTSVYNFEPAASLSFTRYLCLAMQCQPLKTGMQLQPGLWSSWGYTKDYGYDDFPVLYQLNSGYTNPVIGGTDTYLALDADVIYERYKNRNYINPDWTSKATGVNNSLFDWSTRSVCSAAGCLVCKLGFGNQFWDGSAWTTTETCFKVPLSTNMDEDYEADLTELWNTSFHVLNNFSWEEWADVEGYKIPLSGIDISQEIKFEMHIPGKLQYFTSSKSDVQAVANASLNGYAWVSNFKITIANKGSETIEDKDIVYEYVVDENSINEGDEITMKINTYPGSVPLSYSFVGNHYGGFLTGIKEYNKTEYLKPEENLLNKLVNQYSSTTKKETMTLGMDINPFMKVTDTYWDEDNEMAVIGQEIDYRMDSQNITLIQLK